MVAYNGTDLEARKMASDALSQIATHEKVCTVRWESAMASMAEIKRILAYGTGAIITCLLGIIGFLASHPH